ncbi:MAG TPA: cation:dicarboxylase symporter family transporter, partial [Hyphomonadaceae bacterium]|nr:cation:dicarboxylase symporter family transporter [Hyphomonadaceae bacterium]
MLKWLSILTVLALAAGVAAGAAAAEWGNPDLAAAIHEIENIGQLWLNLLRMTVIPLVFSLLVTGVASVADAASTGRLAARSIYVFAVLIGAATAYACIVLPVVYSVWPVDHQAAQGFLAGVGAEEANKVATAKPPTLGEWIASLAPGNPVSAAAETAVLPLTVFALFFGFAATRLPAVQREPMVGFFRAIADTMIIIVRWVLYAAPIGVLCLSLALGLRSGTNVVGLLIQYVTVACVVTAGIVVMAFLVAIFWARMPFGRFLNASAPVLAVAFSTRSSLASLPLMVERSRDALGIPDRVNNLTLPLAVAIFRMTSPVTNLCVVFFAAQVYGVELSIPTIVSGGIVAIAISVGSVGLPGEISFIASVAPISIAMGVPIELLGILVG